MLRKILIPALASLFLSCTTPKKIESPKVYKAGKETIQYNCYPKKHFAVVSYHDKGKSLRIDHWGYDKNAGCFAAYSVSYKGNPEKDVLVLFQDKDCDGKHEDITDLSSQEFKGNLEQTFANILKDLRDRNRTKIKMKQCLGN